MALVYGAEAIRAARASTRCYASATNCGRLSAASSRRWLFGGHGKMACPPRATTKWGELAERMTRVALSSGRRSGLGLTDLAPGASWERRGHGSPSLPPGGIKAHSRGLFNECASMGPPGALSVRKTTVHPHVYGERLDADLAYGSAPRLQGMARPVTAASRHIGHIRATL